MAMQYYPALIYGKESHAGFDVVFPDLPGCVSAGSTVQQAAIEAAEALSLHLEGMIEDREELPAPSEPGVTPEWLAELGIIPTAFVLVPAEMPGKSVRTNITVEEGLLSRIDAAATSEGNTRSGWLAQAARDRLRARRHAV